MERQWRAVPQSFTHVLLKHEVYHSGWGDAVEGWRTANPYKVYTAVLVPPVVDPIQTILFITGALVTIEFYPPCTNSDSDAEDSE